VPATAARRRVGDRTVRSRERCVQAARAQSLADVPANRSARRLAHLPRHRRASLRTHSQSRSPVTGIFLIRFYKFHVVPRGSTGFSNTVERYGTEWNLAEPST